MVLLQPPISQEMMMRNLVVNLNLVEMYFALSDRYYVSYIDNGKTFLYAKLLKKNNKELLKILKAMFIFLDAEGRTHVLELIFHLEVWMQQWNDLFNRNSPNLDDVFVFDSRTSYPKGAEFYLLKLNSESVIG